MKKIFLLEDLEFVIDEGIYFQGDQLLEFSKIKQLTEVENHLWVAELEDVKPVEVEIKISPSKVLAYTCECEVFKKGAICKHIAAVLIAVRRKKRTNRERKERKRSKPSRGKKLTTNVILDQVNNEELQAFVRAYAKTNRSFAIALKARFASNVSSLDNKEKFTQLLESAINHSRKPDRSISFRGSQKILKILVELQGQMEDAVAKEYLADAIAIAQSIIEKISPILKKLSQNIEIMQAHIEEAFAVLGKIASSNPPPDVKNSIWEYCMEESGKIIYRANNIDRHFFKTALHLIDDKERIQDLNDILDEQIKKYEKEQRSLSPILLLKINVLEKTRNRKAVKKLIEDNLDRSDILFYAINQAMEKKEYAKAKSLSKAGLKLPQLRQSNYRLEHYLYTIAKETKDSKNLAKHAQNLFLGSLNFDYFLQCKSNTTSDWIKRRTTILEKVEKLPYSEMKRNSIASIYTEEEMYEELLAYLKATESIDLLKSFDKVLLPAYLPQISTLYKELLTQYLNTHLGRKTSQKIRECIFHLKEIGINSLANELVEEFRTSFPERHTLMEELAFF